MSRYEPLQRYLAGRHEARWTATFDQIEKILGSPLPSSAFKYPAWWANQSGSGHIQSAAWQRAGWRTARLDLERRRVDFERLPDNHALESGSESAGEAIEERIALASDLTGIADREEVILAALQALLDREAVRAARELGGSMPDFEAPPRERLPQ
jgi:hypothetical protein